MQAQINCATTPRLVVAAVYIALAVSSCQTTSPGLHDAAIARESLRWENAFTTGDLSHSWRGADASYSVPLSEDRVLWLFGDTWIAPSATLGRESARLIRNTIALQIAQTSGLGYFRFLWGRERTPHDSTLPAPFFTSDYDETWLWPLDGIRLGSELVLFMSELKKGGGLGFASAGNVMVLVSDPGDLPERWQTRNVAIPFYRTSEIGDRVFGLSLEQHGDYVYIYGVLEDWRRGRGGRDIIVARVEPEELVAGEFSAWRFFDGDGWSSNVEDAKPLFDEAAAEMSVHYDAYLTRFVAVYTQFGWSEKILARFAESPEGPWSPSVKLYDCPDVQRNPNYFGYAAKAHPEFTTTPGELLISYAVNSTEFDDHVRDNELCWPQFVTVNVRKALRVASGG